MRFDIAAHGFFVYHLSTLGMVLVAVHAADKQRLSVEFQQPFADLHLTKADVARLGFQQRVMLVIKRHHQPVKMRRFGAPQQRFFHRQAQRYAVAPGAALVDDFAAEGAIALRDARSVAPERQRHAAGGNGWAFRARQHLERRAAKVLIQMGAGLVIRKAGGGLVL
ncbi:hypothetical protein GCM10011513_02590 [Franconibacter daqui]|nr:hypothetical protein GCM10011513_02590 [Franconibacter daqui]